MKLVSDAALATEAKSDDQRLLAALQSRSDDAAAWAAAVEVFRRARTEEPVALPEGFRSSRPEVQAVLEAAELRQMGESPHWPLALLLSDSRDQVRLGGLDLLAEAAKDERLPSEAREKALTLVKSACDHACWRTRIHANAALERVAGLPPVSAVVHRFKRVVGLTTGGVCWFIFMLGVNMLLQPLIRKLTGAEDISAPVVGITALLLFIPYLIYVGRSTRQGSRVEFEAALDALERAVRESPASAKEALPELDILRKTNLWKGDVRGRAERLASEIRIGLREALPIAAESPTPNLESLPKPSGETPNDR